MHDIAPEYKVYYAICLAENCGWDDPAYHASPDECPQACPVCGADTQIHQDWDNR